MYGVNLYNECMELIFTMSLSFGYFNFIMGFKGNTIFIYCLIEFVGVDYDGYILCIADDCKAWNSIIDYCFMYTCSARLLSTLCQLLVDSLAAAQPTLSLT